MKVAWTHVTTAIVVVAGAALGWRALSPEALSDDPATVAVGAELYSAQCASCHGAALEGEPNWQRPKPDGGAPQAPPGFKSGMPGFAGTLTDREIRATLAYIKSQWPPEIRARQARLGGG